MSMDLSVIIPAREEMFLQRTIEDVLAKMEAETEVIAVLDGYWPDPVVMDNERVTVIHYTEPIGQRAATNAGARLSQAKYIMKLDAHCAVGQGFDRILMATMKPYWTVIPRQHNLHAFNWKCLKCGQLTYQGKKPDVCKCGNDEHVMDIVWQPKKSPVVTSMRFDENMQFQYWDEYKRRQKPRVNKNIVDTLSFLGACWFMERERYWEIDGLDENHGSWGQVGTEIACKSWLSGGRLCVNTDTWFAHMFRTGNFEGAFEKDGRGGSFPYKLSGKQVNRARRYSRDLWQNNKWPKQKYPLQWLIDKFAPVPGWEDDNKGSTTD